MLLEITDLTMLFQPLAVQTKQKRENHNHIPALSGKNSKTPGAKAIAANQHQLLKRRKRLRKQSQISIRNRHTLEVKLLEPWIRLGHGNNPRREEGPPIGRHEIEISKPRLPLKHERAHAPETLGGALWGDGVAVANKELGSGESLGAVP